MRTNAVHMTSLDSATSVDWRAWGAVTGNDEDTAATLEAYFAAEHASVFRRLLWRRLAIVSLAAWALEASTPLLPPIGLAMAVGLLGAAGIAALIMEQRAHGRLRARLGCQAS